ncbi:MAG: hypothetical protein OEV42_08800, partial [Deltaproteobacteria bacterium]|nr:hypothetical protein [Deltaproteobacteria bacterium]
TITTESKLEIQSGSLNIDSTSSIDVTGKGYLGGRRNGNSGENGRTIGNTASGGSKNSDGGSYGGHGGMSSSTTGTYDGVNEAYGDLTDPNEVGSGGGGSAWHSDEAGNGGGLVRIKTGVLTLAGYIIANGEMGVDQFSGGGSGGGVRIEASTISGSGIISANGGLGGSTSAGSGGGGRIALYYDTMTLPEGNIHAYGARRSTTGTDTYKNGGAGTIYLKATDSTNGSIIVNNDGVEHTKITPVPGGTYDTITVKGGSNLYLSKGLNVLGDLTLVKSGVTASDVIVVSGALMLIDNSVLSHSAATITTESKLEIQSGSLNIDSTSSIDVTGKGYLGGRRDGNSSENGRTIGNTASGGSKLMDGGSYGGHGGMSSSITGTYDGVNEAYGDLTDPNEVGSGGGGYASYKQQAGNGGGLVRIKTGVLTLAGYIIANGEMGVDPHGGGGSGGGVRIEASTISGSGIIRANGGLSGGISAGSGGGGRIALYYDTMTLPEGNIHAYGARRSTASTDIYKNGGAGTIYLKATGSTNGSIIVDNGSVEYTKVTPLASIGTGTITAVNEVVIDNAYSITDSQATWQPGALKGLKFRPRKDVDRYFTVLDNTSTTLFTDISEGALDLDASVGDSYTGVYVLDNLTVKEKGRLKTPDWLIVDQAIVINGAYLEAGTVHSANVSVINGGTLSQIATTGSTEHHLEMNVSGTVEIDADSKIDVTGKGYLGGYKPGNSSINGRTSGNTSSGGSTSRNGGSYGGLGGLLSGGSVNVTYENFSSFSEVGSGGGGYPTSYQGGNGGGYLLLKTDTLNVDGNIIANGESPANSSVGAGSGGGIVIDAWMIYGSGKITANGGISAAGGGGGGGRIAIYSNSINFPPTNIEFKGGLSGSGSNGARNGGGGTLHIGTK